MISKSHVSFYDILLKSRSLCLFDHDLGFSINKHFIITLSACLLTISNGTEIQSYQTCHVLYRDGVKMVPRLRKFFRQVGAEVVRKSRNKIHKI